MITIAITSISMYPIAITIIYRLHLKMTITIIEDRDYAQWHVFNTHIQLIRKYSPGGYALIRGQFKMMHFCCVPGCSNRSDSLISLSSDFH